MRPKYSSAAGLKTEVEALLNHNEDKFVILHVPTGLWLRVEERNIDSYIDGTRNHATGFESERLAEKAKERYQLNQEYQIIPPKTK